MKTISFSEASKDLQAVLNTVNDGDIVFINRQNHNDAVVMSLTHYNGLMETIYLLKSSANVAHLAESIKQYRSVNHVKN